MSAVPVTVAAASDEYRSTFEHLVQLYLHDLSGVGGWDVRDDGTFGNEVLAGCWSDSRRYPYLLRVDDALAGFAIVDRGSHVSDRQDVCDMAEFFVLNRWRRAGIGRSAARQLFAEFGGDWEVRPFPGYAPAQKFWASVCTEVGSSNIEVRQRHGARIISFSV